MICALNEEEFIEECILRKLRICDRVVVAEGPVAGHVAPLNGFHSSDRTLEILRKLEDEHSNLTVIALNRKWKSKQEQQNSMLDYINDGEWALINGADEFWQDDFKEQVLALHSKHPLVTEFIFPMLNMVNGGKEALLIASNQQLDDGFHRQWHHQRFFKYQTGMHYVNHPTINDRNNRDIYFNNYYNRMYIPQIPYYHYCFCANINGQIRKRIYYEMRDRSKSLEKSIVEVELALKKYGHFYAHSRFSIHTPQPWNKYHPLQDWTFKDRMTDIDFDQIRKELENFNELPKK